MLYELLKVNKTATTPEIRKAYYALARKVHPDKNPGDPKAAESFQALKRAYDVLTDPNRRARYDKAGSIGEDESAFQEAYEKYKSVEVTTEDIDEFIDGYKGSEAELRDLVQFAKRNKGDVSRVLESMIGSDDADIPRYLELLKDKIPAKYRKRFEKCTVLTMEELDGEDLSDEEMAVPEAPTGDLVALIAARQKDRQSGFDAFASKWSSFEEISSNEKPPKKASKRKRKLT